MHILAIPFPNIDPVLVHLGPIAIRWYALSYIAGFILGWLYLRYLVSKPVLWWPDGNGPRIATKTQADDILTWSILGVLLGGRLGWALFYELPLHTQEFLSDPLQIFYVWRGGMSFHGGFLGVVFAILWFCRNQKLDIVRIGDAIACCAPFGLCFGRIANFINGEIWGKPSNVPWAVIFPDPRSGGVPRHPSQLYEAALEGAALFLILCWLTHTFKILRKPGLATGLFLILYAAFRIFVEVAFRDSDNKIGHGWTMGIVLSIPMAIAGLFYIWHAFEDRFGSMPLTRPLAKLSTYQALKSK
jgi:phosphatidylglycerol:prolipoprotein diacylglycerol transferase